MATQIADRSNAGMSFTSDGSAPELTKLEVTRMALAQEQKKRIDAAVARVTGKKDGGKRKNMGSSDASHRTKKSKTVVDVGSDAVDKKNSIARRMVNRFSAMPEPEHEEEAAQELEPMTRSVPTTQFVAPSTMTVTLPDSAPREATEKRMRTSKLKMAKEEAKKTLDAEDTATATNEDEQKEAKEEKEEKEEKNDWDGPTTNYHVKQLGLDDKVDIYAPIVQQQYDVQRVRERTKYMPSVKSTKSSSDSEADSDFVPKDRPSKEIEELDTLPISEGSASETQALAGETGDVEEQVATMQMIESHRTWTSWLFVYIPLILVAVVVLGIALLYLIDWSQETFQFCELDAESAQGADEIFSCSSIAKTLSLIKFTIRETVQTAQEVVLSYLK
ncbi:uncharacterized protein PHALS_14036 [Plasmopara halstedii]|uniref:Uncharacterized protein n=1 Tax=Plasmopara halstedii TaxID=4781 RepID=A0A0P1AR81_PLAHL|nr:uncharacterized protein PHALS_14036 [Plasmopara halstedii]CEG43744.1 hypothetical protein PHALS_14036 [Plasmopara halstedii]|eukprot:XP_024580113.1 hypothetical protein PHALS_14036 [Plasmopara halstedii]